MRGVRGEGRGVARGAREEKEKAWGLGLFSFAVFLSFSMYEGIWEA